MRILFLTETIPYPLDSGGRIKTYHTLRMLAAAHEVRAHAFIREAGQRALLESLSSLGVAVALHLVPRSLSREAWFALRSLAGAPYTVGRHFARRVLGEIQAVVRDWRPDLVYCDHLSMAEYARPLGVPIVYDAHNVEHAILRRFAATQGNVLARAAGALEWRRVRAYERDVCRASRLVLAVSDVDRRALAVLAGPSVAFATVPIAVDGAGGEPIREVTPDARVLFLGGLHWPPNADGLATFVRDIWPLVRAARPDATLMSVGRDDHPVAQLCRRAPGVTLTGWVPDIDPFVRQSRVLVVPLRAGSGMRVKILEAMARGLPVVSTSVGCEGIEIEPGRHLLVEDDPARFAAAVARVLNDDVLASRLAGESRALVMRSYDTGAVARTLLGALETVTPAGR
ncbi:MAG: glycosyltransferase [Acidobacteria bacterium]|nr:glycosyltransferase [Acidobacteriota bacterium]